MLRVTAGLAGLVAVSVMAAGCGGTNDNGGSAQTTTASPASTSTSTSPSASPAPSGVGALTGETASASAGDIPDNQAFLTYRNPVAGYSIKVPEGWARKGSGRHVTFQDKNNIVRIDVSPGGEATVATATTELKQLARRTPSLHYDSPAAMTAGPTHVVKVVYSTVSAPSPVTGKRVTLVVDRYYVPGTGQHAVVDLGTPRGVDNVDAYRLMIESFRWS